MKLIIALAALYLSTSSFACMIKISPTSYVNANHVAAIQKWKDDVVINEAGDVLFGVVNG